MKITFTGEHKSLKSFESDSLEYFSVITGLNGSGKTQLIELLTQKANEDVKTFQIDGITKRIQIEGISNPNFSTLNHSLWRSRIEQHVNQFRALKENSRMLGGLMVKEEVWPNNHGFSFQKSIKSISQEEIAELIRKSLFEIDPSYPIQNTTIDQHLQRIIGYFDDTRKKAFIIAAVVAQHRNKSFKELTEADFYLSPIPDHLIDDPNLFKSQLEFVFYNYAKRRDQNQRLFFEKETYEDKNNSISDVEFTKQNQPPWEMINAILKQHDIKFSFQEIDRKDFSSDANITFKLIKETIKKDIEIQFLSSGEKVIIGLIIKLFTSDYYKEKLIFPELLVLDEPDAYLHPEMSKLLIDVLHLTFVKEFGIKVLMTTHSPSTIALCPDNSIYQLKNDPETTLKKIEKDDALKLLTNFIPTLSIDYKRHKQIFVESPTDVYYYQTVFNKLNEYRSYPFKLYFIANGYGKGNCEQVKNIVNELRTSGNNTSFGIIDWDKNNSPSQFVKVHGENKRYSIESYLYDPIYIIMLMMNSNLQNVYNELEIPQTTDQFSIGNTFSNDDLQKLTNWFFDQYNKAHHVTEADKERTEVIEYLNGKKVSVPSWFLSFQGHDFEDRLKKVFTGLDKKYADKGKLQNEITTVIGKCFPFIPKDSELLIEEIINSCN